MSCNDLKNIVDLAKAMGGFETIAGWIGSDTNALFGILSSRVRKRCGCCFVNSLEEYHDRT